MSPRDMGIELAMHSQHQPPALAPSAFGSPTQMVIGAHKVSQVALFRGVSKGSMDPIMGGVDAVYAASWVDVLPIIPHKADRCPSSPPCKAASPQSIHRSLQLDELLSPLLYRRTGEWVGGSETHK